MKHILMAALAAALATSPAIAETAGKKADPAGGKTQIRTDEHAPTNRIDKAVPTMTNEQKGTHPPTNRVGSEVPTMKDREAAKDAGREKTGGTTAQ